MTRATARALETEVNSFLQDLHMDTDGTCLLPHQNMLCLLRYEEEQHQGAQEHHQGEGGPPQGREDQEQEEQQLHRKLQASPCSLAPRAPCPRATQESDAGAPRAHEPVPCPQDPHAHGPPRMAG